MPIPYFEQPKLALGPITIHAFAVFVAIAIQVGIKVVERRTVAEQLDVEKVRGLLWWILIPAFIVAHVFERVVYHPDQWLKDPLSIFWIWQSLSSFGGFLGAVLGAWMFLRRHKSDQNTWRYLDLIAYGFVFGWIFGRLGCTVAFDHPGIETTSFLAQYYSDGRARFNLGMIEAAYFVVLSAIFFTVGRKRRREGFFIALLCLLYGPFRFFLDFARHADARYFALTPAQWGCLAVIMAGLWILLRSPVPETTL